MKKIFAVAALIIGVVVQLVATSRAEAVRLCDYTLGDFIDRYNIAVDGMNLPRNIRINSAPHYASSMNYKGYAAYDTFLGDEGHGVIFFFSPTNKTAWRNSVGFSARKTKCRKSPVQWRCYVRCSPSA